MTYRLIPSLASNILYQLVLVLDILCVQGGHVAWVTEMRNRATLNDLDEELLKKLAEGHHDAATVVDSQRWFRGISCLTSCSHCIVEIPFIKSCISLRVASCTGIASSYNLLKVGLLSMCTRYSQC